MAERINLLQCLPVVAKAINAFFSFCVFYFTLVYHGETSFFRHCEKSATK